MGGFSLGFDFGFERVSEIASIGEEILRAVIRNGGIGFYIPNAEVDTLAAGALTSVLQLRNSSYSPDEFRSWYVYWPGNPTGLADYVRVGEGLAVDTGVLTLDANLTDPTIGDSDVYLLKPSVHPSWFLEALNGAMRMCYFPNLEPLTSKPAGTVVADAGFQKTALTAYVESDVDGGPATTFSKVSLANSENTFRGIASGRVLNAAAGGYIRQRFNVTEQEQVIIHALSRLDVGDNAELVLRDVSNGAFIGTTVEHDQEAWQWMRRTESIPAGCKVLEVRLQGEGATDDVYWNALCVLFPSHSRVILDTTWDLRFEKPTLAYMRMGGQSPGNNVWAGAGGMVAQIPASDYDFDDEAPSVHPTAIQFHNGSQRNWFQYPVYIQGRRAYSDLTTFTLALSESTACDLDLLDAQTRVNLFSDRRVASRFPDSDARLAEAERDLSRANAQFRLQGPADARQVFSYRSI
ncbi:MAG: hypothetical protein GEU71_15680 [Actinobacteria bacterium]|nr:hypothetical protein [Actinomycetota bacterium]